MDKDNIPKVSIQPKPKKGLKGKKLLAIKSGNVNVSIQPKPKKGLKERNSTLLKIIWTRFNPAEAEEGFKSGRRCTILPKFGGFNPAEAEEGFKR